MNWWQGLSQTIIEIRFGANAAINLYNLGRKVIFMAR
ncbi:hypothetical protein SAMN05216420_10813 [Nitrosospira sp. Nl5]|nr:hypothetical protein SAMN05216420_10813 [Nitrosospira sp. Nl5]